ncbi:MAG: DUF3333 domain-containing protein, partial [Gammaproteobacteria bacterium]|nr:DUF3333 domain-containing protein [Gammaproteobacteria bacterium]
MSNASARTPAETQAIVARSLRRRYRRERRFRAYGIVAVLLGVLAVALLFVKIVSEGASVFRQSYLKLTVFYDPQLLDPEGRRTPDALANADYQALVKAALRERFPQVEGRSNLRELYGLASSGAFIPLQRAILAQPDLLGRKVTVDVPADDVVDLYVKGKTSRASPEEERRLSEQQIEWIEELQRSGELRLRFNREFFTNGDSRDPELAGVRGAVMGSMLTLFLTLILSFPIGVAAAVYLEEFAPRNRLTDLIEVNINNLAAVPSIVFGLLGLAIFLGFFGLPRSAPVVGALV